MAMMIRKEMKEFTRFFISRLQEVTLHKGREAGFALADWFFNYLVEVCELEPPPQELVEMTYTYINMINVVHLGTTDDMTQYRYIIIFFHAGQEHDRSYGDVWYNTLEECKQVAEALDFDFCCGYTIEYESRTTP